MIVMSSLKFHTMTAHRLCSLDIEAYKFQPLAPNTRVWHQNCDSQRNLLLKDGSQEWNTQFQIKNVTSVCPNMKKGKKTTPYTV